jgi:hypothetical protein
VTGGGSPALEHYDAIKHTARYLVPPHPPTPTSGLLMWAQEGSLLLGRGEVSGVVILLVVHACARLCSLCKRTDAVVCPQRAYRCFYARIART